MFGTRHIGCTAPGRGPDGGTEEKDRRPTGWPQKRITGGAIVCGLLAFGWAGIPVVTGAATSRPLVSTADVSGLGTVLVSGHRLLYVYAGDIRGHSSCTGACATVWPPLTVSAGAPRHLGRLRGLGTLRRSDRRLQVTIDGHPLYFFAADHSLGQARGRDVSDLWSVVRPTGSAVRLGRAGSALVPSSSTTQPVPSSPPASSPVPSSAPASSPVPSSAPASGPVPSRPPASSPPPTNPPTTTTPNTTSTSGGGVSF